MALAITSFPVPVSPWIKTAESTGATLSTSVSNARNFGLDPIKSKVVTALLLYECEISSAFLLRQPARACASAVPASRCTEYLCSLPYILLRSRPEPVYDSPEKGGQFVRRFEARVLSGHYVLCSSGETGRPWFRGV